MKLLIVDNNIDPDSWGSANLRRCAHLASGAEIITRRAPDSDLPPVRELASFDGIIISGSKTAPYIPTIELPWLGQLEELIRWAFNNGKPVLGVCFGHQMIARTLGGIETVRRAAQPEIGWTLIESQVESSDQGRILKGLTNPFYSFSVHFDEVIKTPPGTRVLARSSLCPIQAFEHESKPLFGIQFHPEKNLEEAERSLKHFASQAPLLRGPDGQKLDSRKVYQEQIANTVFGNFFDVCR